MIRLPTTELVTAHTTIHYISFFSMPSPMASSCCDLSCSAVEAGKICLRGDSESGLGGCQGDSSCNGESPKCPEAPPSPDGTPCNNNENVCIDGACTGK